MAATLYFYSQPKIKYNEMKFDDNNVPFPPKLPYILPKAPKNAAGVDSDSDSIGEV